MKVTTSKSKNSESFYISQSYINNVGKSTSKVIRKLGTLEELSAMLNTDREGVYAWAKEQAKLETEKYNKSNEEKTVLIPFHSNRQLDYGIQKIFEGGYLFFQRIYYDLRLDAVCRKIKSRHLYEYDLNAILSDLIYTRILNPSSKYSSYSAACKFLERPTYEIHDVYRALSILSEECDFIQSEVYKNSSFVIKRKDSILYYDCTNYYFEIEQSEGIKKYGKSKEHRPNPIVQMGLFMDGDGIPLAFSIFPGNSNEQTSLKPLESKILQDFGCKKFIYCSDAGLASESNREFNHMGERAFIVTQSIKKLPKEGREWALDKNEFRRISDNKLVNITKLDVDDTELYYKDIPYTTKKLHQRLIITYSPQYAAYQRSIRAWTSGTCRKNDHRRKEKSERRNPNDPARFVGKVAVTEDGEVADTKYYLDTEKILNEEKYDGLYAVCTDLLDDPVGDILKVSEGRWQIEECFRIMKTDFFARPVYLQREDRITAHFLTCFLALFFFRILEKKLNYKYTAKYILDTLKSMNFADIEEQGFMPLYEREEITDDLHEVSGFRTDLQFISKREMRTIQKKSKGRK